MTDETNDALNIREKLAHIDQRLADINLTFASRDRKQQVTKLAPCAMLISRFTIGPHYLQPVRLS